MNAEIFYYAVSFIAGTLLGVIFYAGLWWTVRKGLQSKSPALWFGVSMVLRTAIILTGFYTIGHDHWERLLACLLGFIVARVVSTMLIKSFDKAPQEGTQNAS